MAKLRTSVDFFNIVDGVPLDTPICLGAFEQAPVIPDRRGRGNLYVLVETVGAFPDPAQVQQDIVQVAQQYLHTSGSITAGIRAAIKNANAYLFERNLKAQPEERGVAGVTLMVLKDRDAYLGQLGPAVAYHVGAAEVRRLPTDSSWLSSESLEDIDPSEHPPLGLRREVEPDLSHLHLQQGDVLVLGSAMLSRVVPEGLLRQTVFGKDAATARAELQELCRDADLAALVVEVVGVGDASASAVGEAARDDEEEQGAGDAGRTRSLWTRISSGLKDTLEARQATPANEPAPEGSSEPFPLEEGGPFPSMPEEVPAKERGLPSLNLRPAWVSLKKVLNAVARFASAGLERVLPAEPGSGAHKTGARRVSEPTEPGSRRWLWLAILIPVLVLAIYGISRWQYERSLQSQIQELRRTADDAKIAAQMSTSASEQRVRLTEALAALDQAVSLKPNDPVLAEERRGLSDYLDQVSGVVRFAAFNTLKEFPDTDNAKNELTTVIVHGADVWTLDVGLDRVYKHLLDDSQQALRVTEVEPVVVRRGDQHGGIAVDELLDIVWVDSGAQQGIGNLFIVDRKGQVLEYNDSTGLKRFASADATAWRKPTAVAGYLLRRFYVLDGESNRVLRYQLNASGFDGAPTDYLSSGANAVISGGVDIAIDGDVYVLQADGKIAKFHQGVAAAFPLKGLDQPLKSPCCLAVTGAMDEDGAVYVADSGNSRIVKFSKSGEFLRQYRSTEPGYLDNLRGLFIDEAAKRAYIVNGNKLLQASLAGQ
jgi:hypothetical protein